MDVRAKADLVLRTIVGVSLEDALVLDSTALADQSSLDVRELSVELQDSAIGDPSSASQAQSFLRLTVKDDDADKVGKPFTERVIEATLASYPGLFPTAPPVAATPYGVYWPTTVARDGVVVDVQVDGVQVDGWVVA